MPLVKYCTTVNTLIWRRKPSTISGRDAFHGLPFGTLIGTLLNNFAKVVKICASDDPKISKNNSTK